MVTAGVNQVKRLLDALDAVDCALHFRVEVLHSKTHTIETEAGQYSDVFLRYLARVKFDGEVPLRSTAKVKRVLQPVDEAGQSIRPEEVGCAATEMQLNHLTIGIEQRGNEPDLVQQSLCVVFAFGHIPGDDAIAAAIETRTFAEGNMNVERQASPVRPDIAVRDRLAQLRGVEAGRKLRCARVGRVARTRTFVTSHQFRVECR